jgi:anti-anti-sigma factor
MNGRKNSRITISSTNGKRKLSANWLTLKAGISSRTVIVNPLVSRTRFESGTSMKTTTYYRGDVTVFRCKGRLVAGEESTAFRQGVKKLLKEGRRVVINLTEVDYVDSTGLAALVHFLTQKRDPESGARVVSSRMRLTETAEVTAFGVVVRIEQVSTVLPRAS